MGSKRSKKSSSAAAPAAAVEDAPATTAPVAAPVAAAPKQSANALADMFAQSSVLFAKKTSYAPAVVAKPVTAAATEKEAGETTAATEDQSATGKRKRKASKEDSDAKEEAAENSKEKTDVSSADTTTEKKQKKKKHKKVAAEKAAAEAAAAGNEEDATTTEEKETLSQETKMGEDKSKRTVFVGNVSLDATQKDLKTFFTTCGKVESVRLRFMPIAGCAVDQAGNQKLMMKVCANKKILTDSKDNCNAYVTFADESSVEKALALNGATFMHMKIRVDHENPVVDPKRSVFVGNVGFNVSDETVRRFFVKRLKSDDEPNPIVNVRIIRDRATGVGKGFGYVLLKSAALATKALALNEGSLDNRPIRVQVCGKRFKNKKGKEESAKKHEGLRASAGAKARVALKRKAGKGAAPEKIAKKFAGVASSAKKVQKPKHETRKALQAKAGKDGAKVFKKASSGDKKKHSSSGKKSAGDKAAKPKVKKPKHAARKARQAAEAAAAK